MATSTKPKPRFGLYGVSMLIGMGCGFVPFDLQAGAEGHIWNSHGYTTSTLIATFFAGLVGISFGWLLNATVHDAQDRRKLVRLLWVSYCCGLFLYLLLRPAIYAAR